ncbi:hypothetical protein Q5P01_024054 [Channa striata]|uniref:Molybdopterin synthase catalytic subunit n=1 Tax=Channa striata TaxID=64152 RepID=A0AA88IPM3_CHASR|nr:hypothetical protein Q5P01_024054 [Channa striata]
MTSQVLVLYFAKSVELTGVKEEEIVDVPTLISSRDLWKLLLQRHPRLFALQDHVILAVRQQYVPISDQVLTLGDGDEMSEEQRDVLKLTCDYLCVQEVVNAVSSTFCGAISLFIGTTREDEVGGRRVVGLEYEAYEPMAQSEFTKLCADIRERWPSVAHICVHHRLGWVKVGEASVVMAISSPHRHEGHQAVQHCISQLKASIPIWKKEVYDTQEVSWKENSECSWSSQSKMHAENTSV